MTTLRTEIDIVAIIPARKGSKRLPRKNVRPLAGKPLIQWSIDAAVNANIIDLVLITSDDDDVSDIAKKNHVKCIYRPDDLASDTATTFDVLLHALEAIQAEGVFPRRIMLLQPTSPLRTSEDIKRIVKKMDSTDANSVISVCETEHSPLWCNTINDDGSMDDFLNSELLNKRSQDLPIYYRLNGALYLANVDDFRKNRGFFMPNSQAYVMSQQNSIDIDSHLDFVISETLMHLLNDTVALA